MSRADNLPAEIVLGTRNTKKVEEIRRMFSDLDVRWRSLDEFPDTPDIVEDAETFEGNARKKASELARALGAWVLADDSGLEVDPLDGAPGVRSHRYAGDPPDDDRNNAKLLRELDGLPPDRRTARFRCVLAVADPSGTVTLTAEGTAEGRIADAPRGSNDFGYDPLFLHPPSGRTFAELAPKEKDAVSHRGAALRLLRERLAFVTRS